MILPISESAQFFVKLKRIFLRLTQMYVLVICCIRLSLSRRVFATGHNSDNLQSIMHYNRRIISQK